MKRLSNSTTVTQVKLLTLNNDKYNNKLENQKTHTIKQKKKNKKRITKNAQQKNYNLIRNH
jgi:hypothetical protein